ncbi:hypothetical protein CEXT_573291 [Caerostris extrusa]|uniref:Uncharacterized protein n=1 Tax=Caerostris extrusa TaxID=172846 RepID=A0AAV4RHD2_CAEEX|nr:hypothetical protein CEXT_573291 [Caerostris extrusa]
MFLCACAHHTVVLYQVVIGGAIIGAGAFTLGIPAIIAGLGFEAAGVAAGSIAAAIHSWIGVVSSGSLFAFLQSVGAVGLGSSALAGLGSVGAFLGGLLAGLL